MDSREPAERQPGGLHRHLSRARRQRGADLGARAGDARRAWQPRFPDGHAGAASSTTARTFVADTIHEVIKTLGEAFVLVVIVVFLFLGNLRATIIPTVAVPVSLIGTFAVLLALGFSANTVSLLAMVLAIGIVVDDAIVVVENVERVMEEEPDLHAGGGDQEGDARRSPAPIIAITLVLLSVFVPIGFIPGMSGQLFRQFAVTISVAMVISAINALTLSPALCAVFLRHHRAAAAASWAACCAASTRCATAMPAIVQPAAARRGPRRSCWSRVFAGRHLRPVAASRPPASCRRRTRAPSSSPCSCRTAPRSRARSAVVERVENIVRAHAAGARTCCRSSASRCSTARNEPNAAFMVVTAEAVRRPHRARPTSVQAVIGRVFGAVQQIRSAMVLPVQPAADHRPVHQRRLRIPAGEPGGRRPGRDGQRDAAGCSPPPTRTRG